MQCIRPKDVMEVLQRSPVRRQRLRTNARAPGAKMFDPNSRDKALQGATEFSSAQGTPDLVKAHGRVFPKESPEAAITQRIHEFPQPDVGPAVPLAGQR